MSGSAITVAFDVPLPPEQAFERLVEELSMRLARSANGTAMRFEPGHDGRLVELRGGEEVEVARVRDWRPAERIELSWRPADWGRSGRTAVELRFEPADGGTRVTFEHRDWGRPIAAMMGKRASGSELVGWFADKVLGPVALATAPSQLGEWLTDRGARRPTGPQARDNYRDPKHHQSGFRAALAALDLRPDDVLLEVGCGGGALLRRALRSGCRAVGVDHSEEMVRLTRETNAEALAEGRLEVVCAPAEQLPFADGAFTCAAMTHVFFFLEEPVRALRECRRVLGENGRLAVYTAGPALRGTPAAPEPIARWMHLYEPEELRALAREAGFTDVDVAPHGGANLLTARAG